MQTIALNLCRQRFRQSARRPSEIPLGEQDVAEAVPDDRAPTIEDLTRALKHLPFNQRAALVMREFEDRSAGEIAAALEVSVAAVETLLFRARALAALAVAAGPPPALAANQSLQVRAAPGAVAGHPVAVAATGEVAAASTIAIYAQRGGSACASQAAGEPGLGATLVDQRALAPGPFSFAVSFTPATAGPYLLCTYLDSSGGGAVSHQNEAFAIAVAPAPAPPGPVPAPVAGCTVPSLARHTLGGARHLLAAAGCKLGRVYRPSARVLRAARRRAGGRTPTLAVVSQTPAAGTVHIAGYTVAVRLAVGRAPGARAHRAKSL